MDAPRDDKVGVVFVVHGIRDLGFWTSKIARRVVKEARQHGQDFATETSSYGYFAMLPFLLPWLRRQKVEWLMDRYAECRARYPQAAFHFVGHSNGTYLLARALEEYPCARFERVVLAGSVIPNDFHWTRFNQKGQIGAIVNFVATSDWVLALFPKAFQRMDNVVRWVFRRRWFDLGAAGHDGFASGKGLPDVFFVRGGHSAALREQLWEGIAKFVVNGKPPPAIPKDFREKKLNRFWRFIGGIAPVPLFCIAGALIYVTYLLGTRDALLGINLDIEWLRTIVLVAWGWAVYRIVTWL
jgi:pimeloyl-ACP methyl ester carboxylesterase